MGVDRGLVRGFGYLTLAVLMLSVMGTGVVALVTGNTDVVRLVLPVMIVYSGILVAFWLGLAALDLLHTWLERPTD